MISIAACSVYPTKPLFVFNEDESFEIIPKSGCMTDLFKIFTNETLNIIFNYLTLNNLCAFRYEPIIKKLLLFRLREEALTFPILINNVLLVRFFPSLNNKCASELTIHNYIDSSNCNDEIININNNLKKQIQLIIF